MMSFQLSAEAHDRLKKRQRALALVIWTSTLSSLFVAMFLLYVAASLPRQDTSALLIYAVSTLVVGFLILSHRRLSGRRNLIRSDLAHGLAEEITGAIEKVRSQGGYVLKISGQQFIVDGLLGRDLPDEGTVRLSYAPRSRFVLSVESL